MRPLITAQTPRMTPPPLAERKAAAAGPATIEENAAWTIAWPCLAEVEVVQPPADGPGPTWPLRLAAWNLERCKHIEASSALLATRGADLLLATEMDWGCARSGQRHTTADLARLLGLGHVFGVEFVELALGDARESAAHAGEDNLHGLHGNAVLSRWPIGRAALIPLDAGGAWYVADLKQGQRRIGGRNAIAAEIQAPAELFWAVSVHFESASTPELRAEQARRVIAGLDTLAGDAPAVIGGDFNVFALSGAGLSDAEMIAAPEPLEPAFAVFAQAGFSWAGANAPGVTTRRHPWETPAPGLKIDWLFTRGLAVRDPWIAPALGPDGAVLSDHEPIGVTVLGPA